MDAERGIYAVGCQLRGAVGNSEVVFFGLAAFELFGDFPLGCIIFGDYHNAGGVFVEPVYDAGPEFAETAREFV